VTTALELRDVSQSFGANGVLDSVSFAVREGSITALLGPSGVGKTTLLRIICGFETPQHGSVFINSRLVARDGQSLVAPEHRGVGLVPQEGSLFPHLSVSANIAFGLQHRRSAHTRRRVQEMLELVDLSSCADMRPDQLSGGMQQRVALARALAPSPAVVLLDEPFASLDASLRATVRSEIVEVLRRSGATTLWVTHDQQEALSCADTVALLLDRRIAQRGAPVELYRSPTSRQVAEFVGEAVQLSGVASGGTVECALGRVATTSTHDGKVTVILRPEQLELDESNNATAPRGTVVASRFYGHDGEIDVRLANGEVVVARLHARLLPQVGAEVALRVTGQVLAFA
jgi:iron(III) transport system ATP-binding protein